MKRASFVSSLAVVIAAAWSVPAFAQPAPAPEPAPPAEDTAPRPRSEPAPEVAQATPEAAGAAANEPGRTAVVASSTRDADRAAPEGAPGYDLVRINLGLRIGYLPSRAFDTFASNDVLPQFSIDGTYPLFTSGRLVLGAGVGWDVGGRSDKVRGFDSSLTAHRLYVPIEGRWYVSPGLAVFGKVSPGAVAALATVHDPSAPKELSATGWAFSADASVGASVLMGPRQNMEKRAVRFWVTPEIGYAVTTRAPLRGNPDRDEKDLLGSDESTNLRSLALSGFFWRASVGTTF
jgi:hypothetical protein